ncbi:hypothetical protein G3480_08420 [Thiorhodococcus mannitoliphagus]|uniref:VPLPA-CTERM sorting domain-containing protein n=1 Tax=Thiorhodococcus mannitoliphagus TaxID=329406 RepID=A0A6P1DRZ8_9GAMM|nr:hypothetical protein [Thiorhodococcus mannitoliphagus]NEX20330.1 hypothetical protein [Thiorhodococcus mannitoliphagus]
MKQRKTLTRAALTLAFLSVSVAEAATYTFDFSGGNGSIGNTATFTDTTGTVSVDASGWTRSRSTNDQVSLGQWEPGLGVQFSGDNSHTVDNSGPDDFVLFDFGSLDVTVETITLARYGDADISYSSGSVWDGNLTHQNNRGGSGGSELTIALSSLAPDSLWRFFAKIGDRDDSFKISGMTVSAVPLPAAAWLFGSAVLGFVGIGYRQRSHAS